MRYLAASALALCLAASPAAAQHSSGGSTPMGDLMNLNQFATRGFMNQWSATRPAALAGLSKASRNWIKAEVQRQAVNPRPPVQIALDIDRVLERDIRVISRSERINGEDISGALLLKVLMDTRNALAREANRAHGVPEEGFPTWEARVEQAETYLRNTIEIQSSVSVAMARD